MRAARGLGSSDTLTITVNLSGRQLQHPGLTADVASALADSGLDPSSLVLEITESVIMQDTETNLATLRALKALGIRLAIDDFGTGYSSLSYLQKFPVDILKIDKAFSTARKKAAAKPPRPPIVDSARCFARCVANRGTEGQGPAPPDIACTTAGHLFAAYTGRREARCAAARVGHRRLRRQGRDEGEGPGVKGGGRGRVEGEGEGRG